MAHYSRHEMLDLNSNLKGNHKTTSSVLSCFILERKMPTDANSVSKCPSSATSVLRAAMVGWVFQLNGLDTGLQTSKASMQRLHHVVGPENKARCSKMQQDEASNCPKMSCRVHLSSQANGVAQYDSWIQMNQMNSDDFCISFNLQVVSLFLRTRSDTWSERAATVAQSWRSRPGAERRSRVPRCCSHRSHSLIQKCPNTFRCISDRDTLGWTMANHG